MRTTTSRKTTTNYNSRMLGGIRFGFFGGFVVWIMTTTTAQSRVAAFQLTPITTAAKTLVAVPCRVDRERLAMIGEGGIFNADDDDDDVLAEPGQMRVSEMKAELELRQVDYRHCFDRESLVELLQEARATGKADPNILQQFNRQRLEATFRKETKTTSSTTTTNAGPSDRVESNEFFRDEDIQKAVARDGTLPGGMTPEQFKRLASNQEIMVLLQSTKVQEAMKLMMTGGRDELEKALVGDLELQETVRKLDTILRDVA